MFKISFLLILLGSDSRYSNTNLTGYEKSRTIRTKRSPADGTRKRIPSGKETLFQDEVFGHTPESGGTVRREVGERTEMEQHTVSKWLKHAA